MEKTVSIAVVSTHVIQHFTPLYRHLAQVSGVRLKVFYCSRSGLDEYHDPGFGMKCSWDSDLLAGYESEFLPGAEAPIQPRFWANDSPQVGGRLAEFRPQVLIVFGYSKAVMLRALRWANRMRIPAIMLSDSELVHPRARWKRLVKRLVLPRIFGRVSAFVTIGDNNEAYLRHYGVAAQKLFRGAYPTDQEVFWKAREQRAALRLSTRQKWQIGQDEFVALFVGKLIPRKRPLDLLQATIQLSRDFASTPKMIAVFAGDGELRGSLEREANASIGACCKLLGFLSQSELPAAYAAADVLVHPAEEDAHPLTITESAMVGLPVVVSDRLGCIGPTDTARAGQNALVFPTGNVDALAQALRGLVMDRKKLADLEAATLTVARDHSLDACVRGVLAAVEVLTTLRSAHKS